MRRTFLYIVLFLQVLFMGHVQAQNGTVFPVDLNVTLTPPYGPCLDDYVGIGGNRFLCNVLFRDQMKDKTSPVFEYVIEMRVRTMGGSTMIKAWSEDHKAVLGAVEHFDGGRLMKEFLSETNHTGGSTCLKEGPYTMTFRVYDAVSYNHGRGKGIPISQEFSFSVFVDKGAAPELFNPSNKERLSTTTQMVNFQWQLPYVASGMNTYKFVLAKIPQGGNANTDIDNPSYQIRNESVTFPMVQVPVTTLFGYEAQGDGSYAWQVTVCDAEGKQRTNYENQGKSKVFTFTFNDEAWLPDSFVTVAPFVKSINKNLAKLTIDSVEVDNETGAARWTNANLGDADTYHGSIIEVRKKGQDKWTPYIAEELKEGDDEQQLPNLKKGVEYEARGQYYQTDNGDTVYAPYGEIVPFTVPSDIDTMNCADDLPALTDCGDAQPKEIHPGDTIIANGKRVFVDSVSYNGDRLSGSGHLDFPIIKCFKFRMQFKNIKVNCAGELVDGEITSVYDMTNAFILDLNNLTGKGNSGDETFNSTEPTVSKVKNLDDAKKTKLPGDYFEVEGEPNVIYSLDKDKNPVKIGTKLANWTSDTFTHANKMYNNEILLKFSNDRKDQGFDSSEEPYRLMAPSKYESVDGYWVPWLASNPGRVCVVKAKLEGGSISNVKDPEHDVKFVMPLSDGGLMELNTQYKGSGEFEITVMGSSKAGDKLEIYAVIKKTDGKNEEYVDAGRLYVPIYEYRTLKMTVVKVNGANASAVDKSSIESYLNEVYGRIGISFEVTVEEFQSEEAKEFLEDGLDVCGAGGFMTATTEEMRQLKRLYMDSKGGSVDEKRLYLFLVNKAQCTGEDSKIDPSAVCGDMPRNSKVGYLFAENAGDQASFNRTVAHELGHGAFTYEHPFDNAAYTVEQGTTHNLMDYVTDDDLAYFQWQSTLGLNLTWGFLEDDEDGMMDEMLRRFEFSDSISCVSFQNHIASIFAAVPAIQQYFTNRIYYKKEIRKWVMTGADFGNPNIRNVTTFETMIRGLWTGNEAVDTLSFPPVLISAVIISSIMKKNLKYVENNNISINEYQPNSDSIRLGATDTILLIPRNTLCANIPYYSTNSNFFVRNATQPYIRFGNTPATHDFTFIHECTHALFESQVYRNTANNIANEIIRQIARNRNIFRSLVTTPQQAADTTTAALDNQNRNILDYVRMVFEKPSTDAAIQMENYVRTYLNNQFIRTSVGHVPRAAQLNPFNSTFNANLNQIGVLQILNNYNLNPSTMDLDLPCNLNTDLPRNIFNVIRNDLYLVMWRYNLIPRRYRTAYYGYH